MPLASAHRPGVLNAQGVHFAMLDGNTTIRVLVTRVALQGGSSTLEGDALLSRFEAYRDAYEIVANYKFENGEFKGSIAITLEDLAKFLGETRQPSQEVLAA
jgi:Protein of unknown function (DUF1488)